MYLPLILHTGSYNRKKGVQGQDGLQNEPLAQQQQ